MSPAALTYGCRAGNSGPTPTAARRRTSGRTPRGRWSPPRRGSPSRWRAADTPEADDHVAVPGSPRRASPPRLGHRRPAWWVRVRRATEVQQSWREKRVAAQTRLCSPRGGAMRFGTIARRRRQRAPPRPARWRPRRRSVGGGAWPRVWAIDERWPRARTREDHVPGSSRTPRHVAQVAPDIPPRSSSPPSAALRGSRGRNAERHAGVSLIVRSRRNGSVAGVDPVRLRGGRRTKKKTARVFLSCLRDSLRDRWASACRRTPSRGARGAR